MTCFVMSRFAVGGEEVYSRLRRRTERRDSRQQVDEVYRNGRAIQVALLLRRFALVLTSRLPLLFRIDGSVQGQRGRRLAQRVPSTSSYVYV